MAATTTTVTGPIETLGGSALSGKYIRFTLLTSGTETATGDLVAASTTSELLDANGDFSATLWVNGESGVESIYRIEIPGDTLAYDVIIPTSAGGGSISVEDLIENHQVTGSVQQSSTLAQAQAYTDSELDAFAIDPATAQVNFNATNWIADLGLDADLPTFSVPANTTISTFGASLVDDADAFNASLTLGILGLNGRVHLGASSTAEGFAGTAVGNSASASGLSSIAIGSGSGAIDENSVQIGTGTNSTPDTIQFLGSGSVTAAEFGLLSGAETVVSGGITDNDSAVPTSAAVVDYAQPISQSDVWTFSNTTTSGDPGSGNFRLNNATQASATELYISKTSKGGVEHGLDNIVVDSEFRITQSGTLSGHSVRVTATPTDNTTWISIPITIVVTTGPISNNKDCLFQEIFGASTNRIQFDQLELDTSAVAGPYTEGVMRWNDTDKAVEYDTGVDAVTLQIGQESLMRVRNATGSTITNGSVVRVSGATGNRPNVVLAQADTAANASGTLGIATHDIENNTDGFVTTQGLVRGFDTSSFSEGDVIYLSDTVAGGLDATEPNIAVKMGVVTTSNVSTGAVAVNIETTIPIFGSIYVDGGSTAQSIPSGASYTKSTAFSNDGADGNDSGGVADAANNKLVLSRGVWHVTASVSFSSGTSNINVFGSLFLDGVELNNLHFQRKVGTGADVGSAAMVGIVVVDQDTEDLDFRLRHDDAGADNITIVYANMNGHKVSS